MYSLIIADDEAIEREALKLLIRRNLPEISMLEDAENGIEFLNKVETFNPDISIVDINMPGLDGLKAIQVLKHKNIKTKVIIHSAYNSFQYAQKAVSLGAVEYLLKPVKKDKIIALINKCIDSIEIDRKKETEENQLRKAISDVSQTIETDFLSSLLIGDFDKGCLLNSYLDILGVNFKSGNIITIFISDDDLYDVKSIKNSIIDYINNEVSNISNCISCSIIKNRISLFLQTENIDTRNFDDWSNQLIEQIKYRIKRLFHVDIHIESSPLYDDIQYLASSFRQSINGILDSSDKDRINSVFSESNYKNKFYMFENNFIKYIKATDIKSCERLIEEFFVEMHTGNINSLKEIVIMLLSTILKYFMNNDILLTKSRHFDNELIKEVRPLDSLSETKNYILNMLRSIITEISSNKNIKVNKLIKQTIEYINNHYSDDISLCKVADEIGITPYYLSRLFKQEINENFVDYITNIRIDQAINLLIQDSDRSIKELSECVGYNNSTYFCKVFKKITGKTVNDFKDNRYSSDMSAK